MIDLVLGTCRRVCDPYLHTNVRRETLYLVLYICIYCTYRLQVIPMYFVCTYILTEISKRGNGFRMCHGYHYVLPAAAPRRDVCGPRRVQSFFFFLLGRMGKNEA